MEPEKQPPKPQPQRGPTHTQDEPAGDGEERGDIDYEWLTFQVVKRQEKDIQKMRFQVGCLFWMMIFSIVVSILVAISR